MDSNLRKILEAALAEGSVIMTGLRFGFEDSTLDINRGKLQGLLMAAEILTGKSYTMGTDGIYCEGELIMIQGKC